MSSRFKEGPLLWWTPQMPESDGGLPKGQATGQDLLQLLKGCPQSREGRLYGAVLEPTNADTDNVPKPQATSFFPLWKLKGNQPASKAPIVHLAHLEEEGTGRDEDEGSDNPEGIEGVNEELMVHLVRAVKGTQTEEKCCYHCSSTEHFIHNCLLIKTLRENTQLNCKEGTALKKETQTPQMKMTMPKNPQEEVPKV